MNPTPATYLLGILKQADMPVLGLDMIDQSMHPLTARQVVDLAQQYPDVFVVRGGTYVSLRQELITCEGNHPCVAIKGERGWVHPGRMRIEYVDDFRVVKYCSVPQGSAYAIDKTWERAVADNLDFRLGQMFHEMVGEL